MKFYHLADLHFGKSIYGLSMLENGDQRFWVDSFLKLCREDKPDAVVIAGDVYDRSSPSGDAVELLDFMLSSIAELNIPIMLISGNHDSGQRLSFGRSAWAKQNIHIAGTVKKEIEHVTLKDDDGEAVFWLMPYLFPDQISRMLEDEGIHSYDQAVRALLKEQNIDFSKRNVLVAHQNVVADGKEVERGGSESMVGGVGQIDYTAFDGFDYVALGHIHSGYSVGRDTVRYSGTPLCYHLEETRQKNKGPVLVELGKKSDVSVTNKTIKPLHLMRNLVGTKQEIYSLLQNDKGRDEYIGITITDERISPETNAYLRSLLSSRNSVLMQLMSTYTAFANSVSSSAQELETKSLEELFSDLYTERSGGTPPSEEEYRLMELVAETVRNHNGDEEFDIREIGKIINSAKGGK